MIGYLIGGKIPDKNRKINFEGEKVNPEIIINHYKFQLQPNLSIDGHYLFKCSNENFEECLDCDGKGQFECPNCEGTGEINCKACDGEGGFDEKEGASKKEIKPKSDLRQIGLF